MTQIFNDNIDVTLLIDGEEWLLNEAEVELSRISTPNYVDLQMIPDPDETELPDNINNLIGAPFELSVDNTLISDRDTDAEEDNLLFKGNLANISPTGQNVYEALAYDPGQQQFDDQGDDATSILNQWIEIPMPAENYQVIYNSEDGTVYPFQVILASDLIERIVERAGITDYEIDLEINGVQREGDEGVYVGAVDTYLYFEDTYPKIGKALEKAREQCKAEWWFDKEGTFHFGLPDPTRHELKFIKDTSAGKTTPPYQSVRVIGSGSASQDGYSRTNMKVEDEIVVEASIALNDSNDPIPNFGETKEPTFVHRNAEISTNEQARNTATKIIEDLSEQQSEGKITVVGFPEIVPFDGVVMPNGIDGDYDSEDDIRNGQPMGGMGYNVYKVVHRLNNSDGFITIIHVAGITGVTATQVSSLQANTTYDASDTPALRRGVGGAR